MTREEARGQICGRLEDAGIESAPYETWLIMEEILSVSREDYYADPREEIPQERIQALEKILMKREDHYPLQYLLGSCEFMGFSFRVDERVLIPRQDTECLVEEALSHIRHRIKTDSEKRETFRVLDLCTGSGCIGISVKLLCPEVDVVLTDLSEDALDLARRNAGHLGAGVLTLQGDLFEALDRLSPDKRRFDLILSNPPYIPSLEIRDLMPEVRDHEPGIALDGDLDGLAFYRKISGQAPDHLTPGGSLFFEIGCSQASQVKEIMTHEGFRDIRVVKDLAGLDRIIRGRLS